MFYSDLLTSFILQKRPCNLLCKFDGHVLVNAYIHGRTTVFMEKGSKPLIPEHDIFTTTGPLVHLTANYDDQVSVGNFTVDVSTAVDAAVEGAMVGLCQGEVTLGSGYTDASGSVTINVESVPSGEDVKVTVTAHNLYPLQATVPAWQTGVEEQSGGVVSGISLNIGTPITGTAAVNFTVPSAGHTNLSVFDMNGRVVETLVNNEVAAGDHSVNWGANTAGGIYFLRLTTSDRSIVKNCVVLP